MPVEKSMAVVDAAAAKAKVAAVAVTATPAPATIRIAQKMTRLNWSFLF
jgi:hypothetical protein